MRVRLNWSTLRGLLSDAVLESLGIEGDGAFVEIDLKQNERGSPSYKVGEWTMIAKVTVPGADEAGLPPSSKV